MNRIFNFSRFARLFRYECLNYFPRHMKGMLIYSGMIVFLWLFSCLFEHDMPNRTLYVEALFYIAISLAPYFVYGEFNHRKKGYIYAILPASVFEKYLSMLLMCLVVIPVATYLLLTLTDTALYCLSFAGVGGFVGLELYNPFTDSFLYTFYDGPVNTPIIVTPILFTMMSNAMFRKYKIINSLIVLLLLCIIALCCFVLFYFVILGSFFLLFVPAVYLVVALYVLCPFIIVIVTQSIVYYRIKNVYY